jgi:pyruvate/2-oxoglutarate dehydrogenase complex dihydrolipoamide acyltransferase (E2) component
MGKIIVSLCKVENRDRLSRFVGQAQAGANKIPVGQVIAMLAEEGDDLSAIKVPSDLGPEGSATPPAKEEPKGAEQTKVAATSTPKGGTG